MQWFELGEKFLFRRQKLLQTLSSRGNKSSQFDGTTNKSISVSLKLLNCLERTRDMSVRGVTRKFYSLFKYSFSRIDSFFYRFLLVQISLRFSFFVSSETQNFQLQFSAIINLIPAISSLAAGSSRNWCVKQFITGRQRDIIEEHCAILQQSFI